MVPLYTFRHLVLKIKAVNENLVSHLLIFLHILISLKMVFGL